MGRRKKVDTNNEEAILIRPRRLDLEKQIPILRPKDLSSVLTLKRRITTSSYDRLLNSFESITKEDLKFLNENEIQTTERVPIPEVKIREIESTEPEDFEEFRIPKNYICTPESNTEAAEIAQEYEMDEQDEIWLKEYNISKIKKLDELDFERIFALIERETQAKNGFCSVYGVMNLSQKFRLQEPLNETDIFSVIEHWMNKNKQKFLELQSNESVILNLQEEISTMKRIRQDFERIRVLIDLLSKRERLKKKLVLNTFEIFKSAPLKKLKGKKQSSRSTPSPIVKKKGRTVKKK